MFRAVAAGKAIKQEFIEKQFKDQTSDMGFFDPIKKLKLLTMEVSNTWKQGNSHRLKER